MIGNGADDDTSGAYFDVVADFDIAQDFRAGADDNFVANGRMALAGLLAGSAEGDALIHENVVPDFGGLADNDAHAVVDEEAAADGGSGMDFNAGHGAGELRDDASEGEPASAVDAMGDAVDEDGVESGVAEEDFKHAAGGGVALEDGMDLLPEVREHVLNYYRVIGWGGLELDSGN